MSLCGFQDVENFGKKTSGVNTAVFAPCGINEERRGTMQGWIYRRAVGLKDFGERLSHIKIFGIRIFWLPAGQIIRWGLALRDWVLKYPIR
jgi:hypothetical protein